MADASLDDDTLESLIDEFTRRARNGERPAPEEYAARRPDLSEKILAFFPALQLLVEFGPSLGDRAGPSMTGPGGPSIVPGPTLGGPGDDPAVERPVASRVAEYEIIGELGRGGMGAVFRGRDSRLGRDLAVKVLLDRHQDQPRLVRRFLEEARISGQLQHPGVVPVYELGGMADLRPYFTMKLVQGRTLADLLGERPSRAHDLPRFLAIFEAICQTVAYAHSRGVIHRDLKPANVMVGSFGEVQVLDWGLAKFLRRGPAAGGIEEDHGSSEWGVQAEDLSEAGSALGTPAYMAPEQARGELDRVDERADVFSLGSILCAILTGQPAFTGKSQREVLGQAMRGDLAAARDRLDRCGADPELLELARDALAPNLGGRPGDAGAIASRLTAHLLGVQDRLRAAELARGAEAARAEAATCVAEAAEARARAERRSRRAPGRPGFLPHRPAPPGRRRIRRHRAAAGGAGRPDRPGRRGRPGRRRPVPRRGPFGPARRAGGVGRSLRRGPASRGPAGPGRGRRPASRPGGLAAGPIRPRACRGRARRMLASKSTAPS